MKFKDKDVLDLLAIYIEISLKPRDRNLEHNFKAKMRLPRLPIFNMIVHRLSLSTVSV